MVFQMLNSRVGSRIAHASLLVWYFWLPPVLQNLQWTGSWCIDCRIAAVLVGDCTSEDARHDCQHLHGYAALIPLSRYVIKGGSKHRNMTDLS